MKRVFNSRESLTHEFFYKEHNEGCNAGSCSFKGNVFNSYYTTIGYIYTDKNGKKTLLVDNSSMSPTTSKHKNILISACPFDVIYVPFKYGESLLSYTQNEVVKWLSKRFAYLIKEEMKHKYTYSRKEQREYATDLLGQVNVFMRVTGAKVEGAGKYDLYLSTALNTDTIKKRVAKERALAKAKDIRLQKSIERLKKKIAKTPFLSLLERYFVTWRGVVHSKSEEKEKELFIKLWGIDSPSFVYVDKENNTLHTTQGVTVEISKVVPLLKRWNDKQNMLGVCVDDMYKIISNNDTMVKIGCHNIPTANIKALCEELL